MIWADDTFSYRDYKGKGQLFETFSSIYYEDDNHKMEWQIDYAKELGMYRITKFKDNHWDGDLVFDEIKKENANAYCPICDADRWISDIKGYCCKCGHHLNRQEK